MKNYYFFIGTKAELIKLLPVLKEFQNRGIPYKIIASGQNNIVEDELFSFISGKSADIILSSKPIKQFALSLLFWYFKTLIKGIFILRPEFKSLDKKNSVVIVHGDTFSTTMGAILGRIYGLSVAHLEAGLRSFNIFHPFPEEIDRIITSYLSNIHFCPNQWSVNNLKKRKGHKINTRQNTLLDSLSLAIENSSKPNFFLEQAKNRDYFIFVLHRQENIYNEKLVNYIIDKIVDLSQEKYCFCVLHELTKVHFQKLGVLEKLSREKNIKLIPRLPYIEFMQLLNQASFIITDGGSNQEESYYLGKPCLVLRKYTERLEGLGHNVVLSKNNPSVINDFINNYQKYSKEKIVAEIKPSHIIVDYLTKNTKSFNQLDWDSNFFGFPIARLEEYGVTREKFKHIKQQLLSYKIKLAYWFVDPADKISNQTARAENVFLADQKVTYSVNLNNSLSPIDHHIKSYLQQDINSCLEKLAWQSGYSSRFKVDQKFKESDFKKLYREWMIKSLEGQLAKDVLVYLVDDKEVGVITLGDKNGRCDIGLLAVDQNIRGRGIGQALIKAAFKKASDWGYKEVQVVTQQDNNMACKFYEKVGFKKEKVENIYHLWLD